MRIYLAPVRKLKTIPVKLVEELPCCRNKLYSSSLKINPGTALSFIENPKYNSD